MTAEKTAELTKPTEELECDGRGDTDRHDGAHEHDALHPEHQNHEGRRDQVVELQA